MELEQIAAGLRGLGTDKAVWSLDDLRRHDDSSHPVQHRAASLYEYFRADDGRPLVEALRDGVQAARASGRRVLVTSPARSRSILLALLTAAAGLLWLVLGGLLFPNVVLVPGPYGSGERAGFLAWPQGGVLVVVGLWRLLGALFPGLHEFDRRRAGLVYLGGCAAWGVLVWLTWRG